MSTPSRGSAAFFVGFLVVALVIAGGLSYFASSAPDGLDTAALDGCRVTEGEQLTGECLAQNATDHAMSESPLADYSILGGDGTVGFAGIVGVVVTLALAGGLFWLLRRRGTGSRQ